MSEEIPSRFRVPAWDQYILHSSIVSDILLRIVVHFAGLVDAQHHAAQRLARAIRLSLGAAPDGQESDRLRKCDESRQSAAPQQLGRTGGRPARLWRSAHRRCLRDRRGCGCPRGAGGGHDFYKRLTLNVMTRDVGDNLRQIGGLPGASDEGLPG